METKKMTLANMQGKLSRAEMKNLMAGNDVKDGNICKACQPNGSTGGNYGCISSTGKASDCKCLYSGYTCNISL